MNIAEFIGSAAGGSALGAGVSIIGRFLEPWNKKREAQVEVMLLEARTKSNDAAAAWAAFTASQNQDDKIDIGGLKIETLHPVVANFIAVIVALASVFKTATRPALTWGLLTLLAYVWTKATGTARDDLTRELTFGAFTAFSWYFGARPTRSK